MNRIAGAALVLVCTVVSLRAADLTGKYLAVQELPNGEKRETTFAFIADGSNLSGYVSNAQGDLPIVEGKIDGDQFSFSVVREQGIEERKIPYQGRVTGD
ncbi:MAG: hypothetical protein JO022_07260, partial [Acidobacteriaceae bacterium]|nr:hypothetical protein [Acidobacteriaceae bacterium]